MLLNLLVFDQKGDVNSIFAIIPAIAYDKEDSKTKNKEQILERLRHDSEANVYGKHVIDKNPSLDISTVKFYYTPLMEKQQKYKKLPCQLTSTITVIDAFTCIGSRFGLDTLSVIVEVCQSNCGLHDIWANIYYVADSEIPATTINIRSYSLFVKDCHIPK
jgi:hypothetical protein